MNNRTNKTSICCIVFLDIIGYSKNTDIEQLDVKKLFNALVCNALKDVAVNDRIILDTGDGAAITYMGSPEDALYMAMSIRDGILKNNASATTPLYVRFGINLGPVRIVNDINEQPNVIGDGINVAQRIMSFAKPNQILVSRSYFELTSRLTDEISKLFDYSGVHQDKHVREHEVYSVKLTSGKEDFSQNVIWTDDEVAVKQQTFLEKLNWFYVIPSVLILIALLVLLNVISDPDEPKTTEAIPVVLPSSPPASDDHQYLMPTELAVDLPATQPLKDTAKAATSQDTLTENQKKSNSVLSIDSNATEVPLAKSKSAKVKGSVSTQSSEQLIENKMATEQSATQTKPILHQQNSEAKSAEHGTKTKQAFVRKCSQAEISMNQCR